MLSSFHLLLFGKIWVVCIWAQRMILRKLGHKLSWNANLGTKFSLPTSMSFFTPWILIFVFKLNFGTNFSNFFTLNENFQNVFFEIELGKFRKTHSENLGGEKERNFLRIHILDPVFCWGIKVQPGWMKLRI
jgi:hypothetical protein